MKKLNIILDGISIEIPPLTKDSEGYLRGGFIGITGSLPVNQTDTGCSNNLCSNTPSCKNINCINEVACTNDGCYNSICNNDQCKNTNCMIIQTTTGTTQTTVLAGFNIGLLI